MKRVDASYRVIQNDYDFFDHLYRMFNIKRVSAARMIFSVA